MGLFNLAGLKAHIASLLPDHVPSVPHAVEVVADTAADATMGAAVGVVQQEAQPDPETFHHEFGAHGHHLHWTNPFDDVPASPDPTHVDVAGLLLPDLTDVPDVDVVHPDLPG